MANITEEHLHHMARRHHATMQRLNTITEKIRDISQKSLGVLGSAGGAWAGGLMQGRLGGKGLGPIPYNLLTGIAFLVAGYTNVGDERFSEHFTNIGNGFVASYLAGAGQAFGKRWRETGKVFGGFEGRPWTHPYENGWPKGAPLPASPPMGTASSGWGYDGYGYDGYDGYVGQDAMFPQGAPPMDPGLTPAQMAAIVQNMEAAAAT